ncbi:hypothetical protein BDY19DRAFT_996910 [Irpex rosettiformis]|uniref:Uncharacterized protein n=1 Tax=Irpex rosettiformis TaxID=378272 RepID=A0ACB8TTP3_9APHY|nr:hypothetical protein BDY19DRAFT_996910 [Irpex rosettiformis]
MASASTRCYDRRDFGLGALPEYLAIRSSGFYPATVITQNSFSESPGDQLSTARFSENRFRRATAGFELAVYVQFLMSAMKTRWEEEEQEEEEQDHRTNGTRHSESTLPALSLTGGRGQDVDVLIEPTIDDARDSIIGDSSAHLPIRTEVEWVRLEQTFTGATSPPPLQRYFTLLYYLFPCNTLRFLRLPAVYLEKSRLGSPYTSIWEEALDEDKIRSKSEDSSICGRLLRVHVLHPLQESDDDDEDENENDGDSGEQSSEDD